MIFNLKSFLPAVTSLLPNLGSVLPEVERAATVTAAVLKAGPELLSDVEESVADVKEAIHDPEKLNDAIASLEKTLAAAKIVWPLIISAAQSNTSEAEVPKTEGPDAVTQ